MRRILLPGLGAATTGILLVGLAPAFAAAAAPARGTAPTTPSDPSPSASALPTTPSPNPSTTSPDRYRITVEFSPGNTVRRGGTIGLDLHPACDGWAASDAFATENGLVELPHSDATVLAPIRTDASFGRHAVDISCNQGSRGRGWFTVVGQTGTHPSGGVGTGGGGAAQRVDGATP